MFCGKCGEYESTDVREKEEKERKRNERAIEKRGVSNSNGPNLKADEKDEFLSVLL